MTSRNSENPNGVLGLFCSISRVEAAERSIIPPALLSNWPLGSLIVALPVAEISPNGPILTPSDSESKKSRLVSAVSIFPLILTILLIVSAYRSLLSLSSEVIVARAYLSMVRPPPT